MYYALVHYAKLGRKVREFRKRYDSRVGLIEPHITLVFQMPTKEISEKRLVVHIKKVLSGWKSFNIHIAGFKKSRDHWLFLLIKEGRDSIVKLHDALYTGILVGYLRKDIKFIPHISLGLFVKKGRTSYDFLNPQVLTFDEEKYEIALKEARRLSLDYRNTFDSLCLIKFNEDLSKILKVKKFRLGG